MLEDAADAVALYSPEGRILAWNRGAERLYGYARDEALTLSLEVLVPENARGRTVEFIARVMAGDPIATFDATRLRKDGRVLNVAVTPTALVDDNGEPYAVAAIERDTGLPQGASLQRQADRALGERLLTAGEMAAGLAHELNQPLVSIVHFCDLASSITRASRIGRRAELLEALDGVAEQAERAGEIVRDLRRFLARRPAERQPHDINGIVAEGERFMDWALEQRGIDVQLALDDGIPSVIVDRTQIEQVIVNLLRNSIEAFEEHDNESPEIVISTRSVSLDARRFVEVGVTDNGPGVAQQIVSGLFSPFQTTKPNGLGMGLWICRSIIEAHGGRLWVDRNVAPGARFVFTLPIAGGRAP